MGQNRSKFGSRGALLVNRLGSNCALQEKVDLSSDYDGDGNGETWADLRAI